MNLRYLSVALCAGAISACSDASSPVVPETSRQDAPQAAALQAASAADAGTTLSAEQQNYLDTYIDKSTIKYSFHAHNGMWVDCVDVQKQPGLTNGMTIAAPPPSPQPEALLPGQVQAQLDGQVYASTSDENGNLRTCPSQTIPIRRVTADNLARFPTLQAFLAGGKSFGSVATADFHGRVTSSAGTVYARETENINNAGLQSTLSIYQPYVAEDNEESISQIWVMNAYGALETAESGNVVYPDGYLDDDAHWFIYWTNNDYDGSGCWNLTCTGFVRTNDSSTLGDTWVGISSPGGTQYTATIEWDLYEGNWWLALEGTWIGYYPGSLYTNLVYGGTIAAWGGEVYNTEPDGHFTYTEMGSGLFPESFEGPTYAAYHQHVQYLYDGYLYDVSGTTNSSYPSCYDTLTYTGYGHSVMFGGSGYGNWPNCN